MSEIITHIPITPRVNSEAQTVPLGFYGLPTQAKFISLLLGLPYTLSINILGMDDDCGSISKEFIRDLVNLGINPEKIWADEIETPIQISNVISAGLDDGWIEQRQTEIMTCAEKGCGKSEFLYIPSGLPISNAKHSTIYQDNNGNVVCRFCHSCLQREKVESLIWNVPDLFISDISIYPDYAFKEVQANLRDISSKGFLITRSSMRDLEFNVGGSIFWLDTDFSNYAFLGMLQNNGDVVNTLITSRNVHRQTALMLAFNHALGFPNPGRILSSSKINIDWGIARDGVKKHGQSLNQLLALGYLPKSIRLFLLQAVGSSKKDVSLKSSDIHFTDLALGKLQLDDLYSSLSLDDLFRHPLHGQITKMLKLMRQGHCDQLNQYQRALAIHS